MNRATNSLICASLALACLAGCQKKEEAPAAGPAEQVGRKLDQAAAKIAPEVNRLGEKAGQALQDAGKKMQGKAEEAQQRDRENEKAKQPDNPRQ
ncbi:MAG: hypothetical protein JWP36_1595 [Paucimonas sp.]|jgi:hypothetical protein|nr:hypothetical protein [Paucimonas sp.]